MKLTSLRVIWSVLLVWTLAELGIVIDADFDRHVELDAVITFAIAGAGIVIAATSVILPRRLYAGAVTRLALPVTEAPTQGGEATGYRTAAGSEHVFRDGTAARAALLQAFRGPFILGVASAALTAALGVVIALGRFAPSIDALAFFGVGLLLIGLRFPRAQQIIEPAERAYSAKLR
jgi:hypothetical protein